MPIPALTDDQIKSEKPFSQAVARDGLRARDSWLRSAATNGGSGIAASIAAFVAAMLGHGHTGADGDGQPIDSPGIANGAVNDPAMIAAGSVDQSKVHDATMAAGNFQDGCITSAMIHGTIGTELSGTWGYDTTGDPPGHGSDDEFPGETHSVSHSLGRIPMVTPGETSAGDAGDWHIRSVSTTHVVLGLNADIAMANHGIPAGIAVYNIVVS